MQKKLPETCVKKQKALKEDLEKRPKSLIPAENHTEYLSEDSFEKINGEIRK